MNINNINVIKNTMAEEQWNREPHYLKSHIRSKSNYFLQKPADNHWEFLIESLKYIATPREPEIIKFNKMNKAREITYSRKFEHYKMDTNTQILEIGIIELGRDVEAQKFYSEAAKEYFICFISGDTKFHNFFKYGNIGSIVIDKPFPARENCCPDERALYNKCGPIIFELNGEECTEEDLLHNENPGLQINWDQEFCPITRHEIKIANEDIFRDTNFLLHITLYPCFQPEKAKKTKQELEKIGIVDNSSKRKDIGAVIEQMSHRTTKAYCQFHHRGINSIRIKEIFPRIFEVKKLN